MTTKSDIATIPPSARIHFIQAALVKLKRDYERDLRGSGRDSKVKETDICIDYLTHIDAALVQAKQAQIIHKEMCARLAEAVTRHGLQRGDDYIDRIVIRALDEAMAIIKGEAEFEVEANRSVI